MSTLDATSYRVGYAEALADVTKLCQSFDLTGPAAVRQLTAQLAAKLTSKGSGARRQGGELDRYGPNG